MITFCKQLRQGAVRRLTEPYITGDGFGSREINAFSVIDAIPVCTWSEWIPIQAGETWTVYRYRVYPEVSAAIEGTNNMAALVIGQGRGWETLSALRSRRRQEHGGNHA